jgi:ribonuclease P protein component
MLKKKERLTREDFNRFFSMGRRTHSPALQVIFSSHTQLHVSVVVSKKIAKRAVKRNRIRRRIYDIVRNYSREREMQGVFIFLVKQPILEMEYGEIRNQVRTHMDEIVRKYVSNTK